MNRIVLLVMIQIKHFNIPVFIFFIFHYSFLIACSRSSKQKQAELASLTLQNDANSTSAPIADNETEPLEPWEAPVPSEFSPEIRLFLIHNAHTAWNRHSCSGALLEQLRQTLEQLKPQTLWIGPDSLGARPLDADLKEGSPPSPFAWVKFLREHGVSWMALGNLDMELGLKALLDLSRKTGMKFIADMENQNEFLPCITEHYRSRIVTACVLSESSRNPEDAWQRLQKHIPSTHWTLLFTSGSPAWQKTLENLSNPPDVIIASGMQALPYGQVGPRGQIRVAVGGDLQNVGELGLTLTSTETSHPQHSFSRPHLASDAFNILEERVRLETSFRNLTQMLGDPKIDPQRKEIFLRRLNALRNQWSQLKSRAAKFAHSQISSRIVDFRVHSLTTCSTHKFQLSTTTYFVLTHKNSCNLPLQL